MPLRSAAGKSLLVRAARDDKILMSRMAGCRVYSKPNPESNDDTMCGRIETGHSMDDALAAHDWR